MTNTSEPRRRRVFLLTGACAIVLTFAAFAAPALLQTASRTQPEATSATSPQRGATKGASGRSVAPATSAANRSATEADAELGRAIAREIEEAGGAATARWGIFVASLRDGRAVYAHDADRTFTPASNMKLYTTAVALDLLGADYRWRTSVYSASVPDTAGTVAGDLVLYGRGAPDLASRTGRGRPVAHLAQLADELYRRGVRRVRGRVVGDESYFRGEPLGDGWLWGDVQWYYGAEVSALSIDDNEITLDITPAARPATPAEIKIIPPTDYVRITNDTATLERGTPTTIGVTRGLSDNEVRVWGEFPAGGRGFGVRLSVHRPAMWAALLFRDALRARGIAVEGDVRASDARVRVGERFEPERAVELASVASRTLGEVVRETNKASLNLQAELILRTLGKERGADAPDPDPQKMRARNDDAAGLAVVRRWLEAAGVATENLALHDGSGLSRLNLVTPEATVKLLSRMAASGRAAVFRDSLPVSGRDGTLRSRLRGTAAERVAAKTGSLTHINSLSGYVTAANGETLAFSIICNDAVNQQQSARAIDRIVAQIAAYPASKE